MKEMSFLACLIKGKSLDLEQISCTLGLTPAHAYKKGDIVNQKYGGPFIPEEDSWSYRYKVPKSEPFDKAVLNFIGLFQPHKDFLNDLVKNNEVIIFITVYPDEINTCIELTKDVIATLYDLGLGFTISYTE